MNNFLSQEATTGLSYLLDTYKRLRAIVYISDVGSGSVSYKQTITDLFGDNVQALFYINSSQAAPTIARLDVLRKLARLSGSFTEEWKRELTSSKVIAESSVPDNTSLIHACVESRVAALITCEPVMALGCIKNWREKITSIWGADVTPIEYCEYEPEFYSKLLNISHTEKPQLIYLRYRGLLILAESFEQVYEQTLLSVKAAMDVIGDVSPVPVPPTNTQQNLRFKIAEYRKELCKVNGKRFLVRLADVPPSTSGDRTACSESHLRILTSEALDVSQPDPFPGAVVHAQTPVELNAKIKLMRSAVIIEQYVSRLGEPEFLLASSPSVEPGEPDGIFTGEVALITGAAMGIGKACVESLLARGAAVIALDIKPEIVDLFDHPGYLGMNCDLTNAAETIECFEKGVRAFGGLDMLVLNAGIFPASCALDSMSMEYWRKVMDINLDVNITLLRESYPLLKCAPRHGRVVINASRNVPAPGPGAAAYSASKAALTQLGRVAALEWGPSHIRVNMLHPHAVFDTGIWTDDVIKSRAAKYGLTVEQYKTNNVLGVELKSHDVGELVAEMLGPVFSNTTGAQIPVDGGSDRVI